MKKAQLFSMMAIFMSALFIIMFSGLTHVALNKNVEITETEIARFGSLAESLDYFVHKSLDTSGYLFLHSAVEKLQQDCAPNPTTDCYYDNFIQTFNDCLAVGESGGWNCSASDQSVLNISYKAQLDLLASQLEARYLDLTINVSNTTVGVTQSGPYTFKLTGEVQIILTRPGYSWNRFFNITREISVMGMKDPALAAHGLNQTIQVHLVEGDLMTVASLSGNDLRIAEVVNNSYYFRDNRSGLSITEMFEGVTLTTPHNDSHPFGITSVLSPSLVEDATGTLENRTSKSLLEHQYLAGFSFVGGNNLYRFDKLNYYGVDDDIIADSGLFIRLGINDFKYVGTTCCTDSNSTYGYDGACDENCG